MNIKEIIEAKKADILPELYEWAETFFGEIDEDGNKTDESYSYVFSLTERLEKGQCNEVDYQDIQFHIEQINYDETKIVL